MSLSHYNRLDSKAVDLIGNQDDEENEGSAPSTFKLPRKKSKKKFSANKSRSHDKLIELSSPLLTNGSESSPEALVPANNIASNPRINNVKHKTPWGPLRIKKYRKPPQPDALEQKLSEFERRLDRDIRLAVDPFAFFEHGVLLTALYSSVCAGSTEFHFGELVIALLLGINLAEEPLSLSGELASGIVAVPASLVQVAFSGGTALNFDIRFFRTLTNMIKERWRTGNWSEFTRHYARALKISLWDGIPSSLGSVVMGYETFERFGLSHPVIFYAILAGRFKAAFNTNVIYLDSDNKRKLIQHTLNKTYNNYGAISLIMDVRNKLKILMRNHPAAFIEAVNLGFLDSVHHSKNASTYEYKLKQLLRLHDYFTQLQHLKPHIFDEKKSHWAVPVLAEVFGTSTCLVNIIAATKIPKLFGLPYATNLSSFVELWMKEGFFGFMVEQPLLFWGFMAALILAGRPSGKSNRLINRDAAEQLINKMLGAWDEGFYNHFSGYSRYEKIVFTAICSLSLFYAFTKMGSALGYPILPNPFVKIPEALFLAFVFDGLAYMSGNSVNNNVINRNKRPLFEKFMSKSPSARIDYFYALENPDRLKLVDLIYIYLNNPNNGVFDAMLFTLATSNQAECDASLSDNKDPDLDYVIKDELKRRFPNPIQRAEQEAAAAARAEAKEQTVITIRTTPTIQAESKTPETPLPVPMLESLHKQHLRQQSQNGLPSRPETPQFEEIEPVTRVNTSLHFGNLPTRSSQTKKQVLKELNLIAGSRTTSPKFKFSSRAQPAALNQIPTLDLSAPTQPTVDLNITPPEGIRLTTSSSSAKKTMK